MTRPRVRRTWEMVTIGVALVLLSRFLAGVFAGGEEACNGSLFSPMMQGVEGVEDFEGDTG